MAASNGRTEVELRCHRLLNKVGELVQEGKRDPDQVARVLQVVKDNPNFSQDLFPVSVAVGGDVKSKLRDWERFFKEVYDFKKNFSKVRIPQTKEGFTCLLVMPEGLTLQKIVEVMQKSMKTKVYIDFSQVTSDRKTDHAYAIWLRDRQEADVELKNLSANDLQQKGILGITLEERLVLEQFYYWKTGIHQDIQNITLCSGSRYVDADGGVEVPGVGWFADYGGVGVGWYFLGERGDSLRSRQAVS